MYFWLGKKDKGQLRSFLIDNIKAKRSDVVKADNPMVKDILEMAERNGVRGGDYKSLVTYIDADKIKKPENEAERFSQMYYMLQLMYSDDCLDGTEIDFCKEYGASLGYSEKVMPQIIREISNGIKLHSSIDEISKKVSSIS